MADPIGYVTIEEADQYVSTHLLKADATRLAWEALDDDDKSVLLLVSFSALESLVYRGRKTDIVTPQPNAFPRWPETEVSQNVKDAQCANAAVLASNEYQEDVQFYNRLKSFGISSYRIGNLSETLLDYWAAKGADGRSAGIYSQEALRLLTPYLQGGFKIT